MQAVATLVRHLLAFAVPIRGHCVELGGCGSHADQHGPLISADSGPHPAPQDDRFWAVSHFWCPVVKAYSCILYTGKSIYTIDNRMYT